VRFDEADPLMTLERVERELVEARKQRDTLAEVLRHCRLFIVERKGYIPNVDLERQLIEQKIDAALAAVKGGEE